MMYRSVYESRSVRGSWALAFEAEKQRAWTRSAMLCNGHLTIGRLVEQARRSDVREIALALEKQSMLYKMKEHWLNAESERAARTEYIKLLDEQAAYDFQTWRQKLTHQSEPKQAEEDALHAPMLPVECEQDDFSLRVEQQVETAHVGTAANRQLGSSCISSCSSAQPKLADKSLGKKTSPSLVVVPFAGDESLAYRNDVLLTRQAMIEDLIVFLRSHGVIASTIETAFNQPNRAKWLSQCKAGRDEYRQDQTRALACKHLKKRKVPQTHSAIDIKVASINHASYGM